MLMVCRLYVEGICRRYVDGMLVGCVDGIKESNTAITINLGTWESTIPATIDE